MSRRTLLVCAISFVAAFMTACGSETLVTKVDPSKPASQKAEGVLFSLPETVVVTEVPLTKVDSKPGLFYDWTKFFYPELTSDDYVTGEGSAFKVGAPTFSTRGQTDPNNVYIAHIKAKQFETKTLLLEFNEDGIIARTEASSKDETIDFVTSTAKTLASFAAPLLPVGAGANLANETARTKFLTCHGKDDEARTAAKQAQKAEATAALTNSAKDQKAANAARTAANAAAVVADACNEDHLKEQLSERELALYESLDEGYKHFLRDNFGYEFLIYVAKKDTVGSTLKSANIEFFFSLSDDQQKFVRELPRGNAACSWTATGFCLSQAVKTKLLKVKAVFDKIQELQQQREELVARQPESLIPTSATLEFKLKELDAQIKGIEQTYFLGTSSETSATAKFEFKPTAGGMAQTQAFFTYAAGGPKPGICAVSPETPGTFKAVWPHKLGEASCRANHVFDASDFRDLEKIRLRLHAVRPGAPPLPASATPDLVSTFLYGNLLAGTKALLANQPDSPQEQKALLTALVNDLNPVLTNGASIYTAPLFDNVKLSAGTLELLATAATPAQIVELNRSLLDDAYAKEIYRYKSRLPRQVSLIVDAPTSGFASTVQTAALIQPGKRSFPYRVAAPTVTKLMDELMDDVVEKGRSGVRIAQFGPVQTLPARLGGRRSSYKITYYDATGAIKIFDMSSDALIQKQNITDLTDAATTLRDAEAAKLKRETELLELRKKKIEAEKALKEAQGQPSPMPQ